MEQTKDIPPLAQKIAETVRGVMLELRPRLIEAALTGQRGESENLRHEDNFLSEHDLWMHGRYRELLTPILGSFVYASEEAEPEVIGDNPDPDLCVLVDPLDTSELAVRGLLGYTHVMVYSREAAQPVIAVVGDIFHHLQLYVGARDDQGVDRAFVITADAETFELKQRSKKKLSESLVTNFLMRPGERFLPLSQQTHLMEALDTPGEDGKSRGRIGVDFGSVSLCHVAAGMTEAVIEFAKGFAVWDLAPGHYILHASGGTVLGLDGNPVPLDYGFDSFTDVAKAMDRRQRFVAAGSLDLATEIASKIQ
ncbi:inositol monophosphatase family protein [Actinoplanes sp. NEAU-A12]|uniref:Inositol monophosphatase family protein n=1 Tax=Actinoplanes sandaracinus TaxID=3045177 RepID=A0ABT6WQK1_9ACTN|nr:inositol monophosphatase family protein [Actinoplanes sandaracinus]MDI6102012.1 inositol monophosphatase family protein [Actinoplanes sandaracinus]